jgi:hypothetical protein
VLSYWVLATLGGAVFPGLAYKLRWPSRLGARGLLLYAVWNSALTFAIRTWLVPWARRREQEQAAARAKLRERLGRDPTEDELIDYVMREARGDD